MKRMRLRAAHEVSDYRDAGGSPCAYFVHGSLSSLDARLAAETEKLAALKLHKKGLMQQLFPVGE